MGFKVSEIDWDKLEHDRRAAMSPEQLAYHEKRLAEEARHESTASEIPGYFERTTRAAPLTPSVPFRRTSALLRPLSQPARPSGRPETSVQVQSSWERPVKVRIEERVSNDGEIREVIRFINAVTGHEAFELSKDFCAMLVDPEENRVRPRFYLCGGTPDRWDSCWVEPTAVEAYIRERRPHLFPETAVAIHR